MDMPPKASEIARAGYRDKNSAIHVGHIFFCDLLSAILEECYSYGRCGYVDDLLRKPPAHISVIELCVLTVLDQILMGPVIPYSRTRYSNGQEGPVDWSYGYKYNFTFSNTTLATLRNIQYAAQYLQKSSRRNDKYKGEDFSYSENSKKEAEREAMRIRTDALKEKDRILAEAQKQAEQRIQEAQRQAEQIVADARKKAEAEARKAAAASPAGQFWQECQRSALDEVANIIRADNEEAQDALAEINQVHDEMCKITSDLKANWYQALEDNIKRLKDMQNDLDKNLSAWQQSLYPRELRPLAQCYTQLYLMISQSNLFSDELAVKDEFLENPSASDGRYPPRTLEQLTRLWNNLNMFQTKFEKALGGLGMYAFFPEAGESFDDFLHTPATEDADGLGGLTVKHCLTPGVMRRTKSGEGEEEVIIPAVVELEEG